MTKNGGAAEAQLLREAQRAVTRTSAISLAIIWLVLAVGLILPAIHAHWRGNSASIFYWAGVVGLLAFAWLVIKVWRSLMTQYSNGLSGRHRLTTGTHLH